MARIRSIKPEYFTDETLAEISRDARLIFPGLWQQADSAGRMEDRPRFLKLQILPYDDDVTVEVFDSLMDQLASIGAITRYQVGNKKYIQVTNFLKHQRLTGKEASTLSTIPGNTCETTGKQQGNNQSFPNVQERKGKERKVNPIEVINLDKVKGDGSSSDRVPNQSPPKTQEGFSSRRREIGGMKRFGTIETEDLDGTPDATRSARSLELAERVGTGLDDERSAQIARLKGVAS